MITVQDALKNVAAIGFDTAPLIYFVERNPSRVDLMCAILQHVDRGEMIAYTSVITLTEVLWNHYEWVTPLCNCAIVRL